MQALVEEFSLPEGRTGSQWFRGWTLAHQGHPREGYRAIREAYEENTRLGVRVGVGEVLGYAAEALLLAGDLDAADAQVTEAMGVASALTERLYLPNLFMTQARIARARGDGPSATSAARRACAEARSQEAPWLELAALLEVCAHPGAQAQEWAALAALVERLPEAASTPPVRRARELLLQRGIR